MPPRPPTSRSRSPFPVRGRGVDGGALQWEDPRFWGDDGTDGRAGYVHRLVVRRAHAGRGLGARILAWADENVRAGGRSHLRLDVVSHNAPLRRYYETAGFEHVRDVTGEWTAPDGTPHTWSTSLYQRRCSLLRRRGATSTLHPCHRSVRHSRWGGSTTCTSACRTGPRPPGGTRSTSASSPSTPTTSGRRDSTVVRSRSRPTVVGRRWRCSRRARAIRLSGRRPGLPSASTRTASWRSPAPCRAGSTRRPASRCGSPTSWTSTCAGRSISPIPGETSTSSTATSTTGSESSWWRPTPCRSCATGHARSTRNTANAGSP